MISDDDIRRVREATDLVALIGERVVLRQKGREFWGCCPFHNEKTPSFKVDPASQLFHCFGCNTGGDAFGFLMKTEQLEFPDAVRYLAQRSNIEITEEKGGLSQGKRARLYEVCEKTAEFYHHQLMRVRSTGSDEARAYLAKRGMGGKLPKQWLLGYASGGGSLVRQLKKLGFTDEQIVEANVGIVGQNGLLRDRFYNRIMFPIKDLQGRVIAFGGRIIGAGEPKYINTSNSPLFHKRENLYAIDVAKSPITASGNALVVEGYTDVIAMHAAGFTNTVATLGTALTAQHVKLLTRFAKKVVYLFDGDEAGKRAAEKASQLISQVITPEAGTRRVDLYVAVLPGGQDPAEFCASAGEAGMQAVLDQAQPLLRFALDRRLEQWDLTQPEQRAKALDDVIRLLVPVKNSLLAADYLNYLSDVFLTDYETVRSALDRAKPLPEARDTDDAPASQNLKPISQESDKLMDLERELLILFIETPHIRAGNKPALDRIEWSHPLHRALAQLLLAQDDTSDPAQLTAALITELPEAAGVLGASRLETQEGEDKGRLALVLLYALREEQLRRAIRKGNAQLRQMGQERSEASVALFAQVAELQQELKELREKQSNRAL